jgi:hypothetical protein
MLSVARRMRGRYLDTNVLKSDGTYNSTDLSVFTNSNSNGADARCGGVWIWNTPVDDAASLAKLAAFSVEQPRRVADGGIGITRRRRA